ncbi:hypothetical protein ACI8B_40074 [Acinetobacter proteolyticus]|uniref:Uncharacterized protein n=1 Tax=Acinetobacter proteolyticus TaxID=1776741 RepID=A0A653K8W4_9GAMM|nr:hypothetical protein ACI8B_40074 [Acinetobacter proteolyticus]
MGFLAEFACLLIEKYLSDLKVSNKRKLVFDNKIKQVIIRNTKHRTLPEVVKLVDAADSKSAVRDDVSVRVRPSGPRFKDPKLVLKAWGFLMLIKKS